MVLAGRPATQEDAARKAVQRKASPTPAGGSGKGSGKGAKDVSGMVGAEAGRAWVRLLVGRTRWQRGATACCLLPLTWSVTVLPADAE